MALNLVVPGTLRQVWQETANLNGGNSRTIPTDIVVSDATLSRIQAVLYVTATAGLPQIAATASNVNGKVIVSVQNTAAPGNTATYILDIVKLQSTQQGRGGAIGVVNVALASPVIPVGLTLAPTDVNVAIYPVVATDVVLEVRRTATGPAQINLPAIATVPAGRTIVVKDSGYNAAVNNITVTRVGGDKINNVVGSYTINVSGSCLWFKANAATLDWEIV